MLPIVESIIFLGRQNIALRGHRDDGPLTLESPINQGNFRELLRYRIKSDDSQFRIHMDQASSRATYISKTTQNEIIDCCGEEILSIVISRIQKAKFYSIMFDETTDISHTSQMTLILRYIHEGVVREDFITFLDLHEELSNKYDDKGDSLEIRLTGTNLGKAVINALKKLNFNLNFCVGITTDGCSVMTSEKCGAVLAVKKEALHAVYSPCYNHILNLSIAKSSSNQCVRNAIGMKETIAFFNASAKRNSARAVQSGGGRSCTRARAGIFTGSRLCT